MTGFDEPLVSCKPTQVTRRRPLFAGSTSLYDLVQSTHMFVSPNTIQTTKRVSHFTHFRLRASHMSSTILQRDFDVHAQGQSCPARLLLTSFRQQRHFTHYTYQIILWVPIVVSAECVENLKQTTVILSQELYEKDFRPVVRHDFVFRIEEYD